MGIDKISSLYIIQHGDTEYYKIGYSNNPLLRLIEMQYSNPEQLKIIALKDTDDVLNDETDLHNSIAEFHIRGEWFKLEYYILQEFIRSFGFTEQNIIAPDTINHSSNKMSRLKNLTSMSG